MQEGTKTRKPNKHSRPQYLLSLGHLGGRNTDAVGVTVEHDTLALTDRTLGGLNPLADTGRGPHGLEETSPAGVSLRAVVVSHDALDGLAGLVGVVEGDVADVVVQHVGLDDSVEDVAADEAEVAVNGGSSAAGEVPHLRLVVRKGRVGVLEEGNSDCNGILLATGIRKNWCSLCLVKLTEPVVHPQVRETVPDQQIQPAEVSADVVQGRAGEKETQVTQDNQLGVLGFVQRAGGVEVVDTAKPAVLLAHTAALRLLGVVVVTGDVVEQVHRPAEELLGQEVASSQDGSLLTQLTELVQGLADAGGVLLTGLGNEDHVAGQVTGGLVVLAVGDLPGEVGDKQEGVADPANSVVQDLGGGEGLVAALVGQNPHAGADETLHDGVQGPEGHAGRHEGDSLGGDIVVEEVEDGSQHGHVTEDIVQTGGGRAVEAVSGNGIANLLDGVVWDLELVTIGIEHLAALLLRSHRGKGGRGGRLARAVKGRGRDRTGR
jgi:hypothetical protein